MDVDAPTVVPPSDELISYFATRPEEFAWSGNTCDHIRARRANMSGTLFFDILLQLGGILDPPSVYPPEDAHALKNLLDAIENASYDDMKRNCLIYYLLKQGQDGRETGYVSEKMISPHYVAIADAYWFLDMGLKLDHALSKLSDARIVKEYSSKVIETLSLESNSGSLIRKYVRTCKPSLRETGDLERYIVAVAEHSIADAWKYQRSFPDSFAPKKLLIHALLTWMLSPKPKQNSLTQILALPFSKYEDAVVQEFARHPPEELPVTSVSLVRDMVCVRLIQSCKYVQAVKFDRQYPSAGGSARGTWGAERGRIVKEILSIIPAVERRLLETELEALGEDARVRTSSSANTSGSWANGSADLSASWEEIGKRVSKPRKSLNVSTRPISSRAPRTSLPNGLSAKAPLFASSASASFTSAPQPAPTQSPLISKTSKASGASPPKTLPSFYTSISSQPETPPRNSNVTNSFNGLTDSAQKTNAFMTRNAFFRPPAARDPSPEPIEQSISVSRISPKRAQVQQEVRPPTPPQDDSEKERSQSQSQSQDGSVMEILTDEESEKGEETSKSGSASDGGRADNSPTDTNGREDLGFSIFNGSTTQSTRVTPPPGSVSPNGKRKSPAVASIIEPEFVEIQRKKPRVSVPGAFVLEDEPDHDLPSPRSATVEVEVEPESLSTAKKHQIPTSTPSSSTRRPSRKRAASPDDDAFDGPRISIPGTLFEEEEIVQGATDNESSTQTNGAHRMSTRSRRSAYTTTDDENATEEAGPTLRQRSSRRKNSVVPPSPAVPKTPRRGRPPRAGSVGVGTGDEDGLKSGRPVRRSSRLTSPHADLRVPERVMMDSVNLNSPKKSGRPRKSTRTAGPGATATGRGATKRR